MDNKGKTFRHHAKNKTIRVSKRGAAKDALGTLEPGAELFILTYGQFSLIDALVEIIKQTGPAHVNISTWTAAHAHLDRSAEMMRGADILSFRMVVDRSFRTRQPKYYNHMLEMFGSDSIREISTHSKYITVRNEKWDLVIRTSMNLNENPRMENIEITDNKEFAEFFEKIVDEIFTEVPAGVAEGNQLSLNGIAETDNYKTVQVDPLNRETLNEPRYTHKIDFDKRIEKAV